MCARKRPGRLCRSVPVILTVAAVGGAWSSRGVAEPSPYIYGIHDIGSQEWLDRLNGAGVTGWLTATVAIGHDPTNHAGDDFTGIANQGHTVICRLNNGYDPDGTIPVSSEYANFATRCANYVANTTGCDYFIIGNETNLASEWPKVGGWRTYISPQDYASCFRLCYDAIKAVRPDAKVLCQALAPWAGPYGTGSDHDAMPLAWTTYMYQMLTAIDGSGGLDGIAVHINSRGYTYADVHSTAKSNGRYVSFYVYKDWVNLGTPASLRSLPYYATECNGAWYWKGGHPECTSCSNPSCCYQADWVEWIYAEIDAWNQARLASGEGIYRCVNMYRWCGICDDWGIDGTAQEPAILADLDTAASAGYRWDGGPFFSDADFDEDNDVDLDDFAHFQRCLTGDGVTQVDADCRDARLDTDDDVDALDLDLFLSCISGSGLPAAVPCP